MSERTPWGVRQEAWRRPIDGYLLIDPDGVVSWADAAAAALLRRAPEELAGRPATVVLAGLDADRAAGTELVATEPGGRELSLRVRVEPAAAGEAYRLAVLSPPHAPGMVSRETFERILTAVDVHPYSGEILEDGTYVEFYTGPNEDAVLGGPVPPGEELAHRLDRRDPRRRPRALRVVPHPAADVGAAGGRGRVPHGGP